MIKGVNYPKGLLAWGNEIGLDRVLDEVDRLRAESGDPRYRTSPLLRRMVRNGERFFA
jgi:3-hydroxybutyryl-CoA dehydrogenase